MEDCGALLATERYGSGESWHYIAKDGAMESRRDGREDESRGNSFWGLMKSVFLPQGYPESVSGDYLQYQFWDTVQAFSSSLSGTLATQASLRGVGVGNQEATVAAATVTWLLRGQYKACIVLTPFNRNVFPLRWNQHVGKDRLCLVKRVNVSVRGGKRTRVIFVKTASVSGTSWTLRPRNGGTLRTQMFYYDLPDRLRQSQCLSRLFADILNDVAMFMEILAPFFPAWFTLIACTSGLFKAVVGVAGGATRAALTVHQARRDNMADISAKDGSQETLVNLAGLLVSLILIPLVTDNPALTISLFFLFTALHLFANYKAVRSVVMETLNEERLSIALRRFLHDGRVLTPMEANRQEPVFLEFRKTLPIKLGVRLQEVVQSPEELRLALMRKDAPFLLGITNGCVRVCLAAHAHTRDEIRATCQAIWLSHVSSPSRQREGLSQMVHESYKLMDTAFDAFHKGLQAAGWDVTRTLLDWDEWRLEWKPKIR
ncbi:RUS family member 1 isoform X1 [Syngnathus scovelli]|uniref:RUS family member 1 isoform X1 n=1 Tax=Syngnathus scovelli TaxID=161590 RepID=UPI00210F8D86|nr:RUS1 family protein C16orf58 homolog isoform X2 [Syngnathus scovelli]